MKSTPVTPREQSREAGSREASVLERRARLPQEVRALLLIRTLNRVGAFSLGFLSLLLTSELGASLTTAGWLLAGFGVASILSRLLGGRLADRWDRRAAIVLGLV